VPQHQPHSGRGSRQPRSHCRLRITFPPIVIIFFPLVIGEARENAEPF
jgi:hypothetical protein